MTAHEAASWFSEHYANDETPTDNPPAFCAGCGHWEFMEAASFDFSDDPVCNPCAATLADDKEKSKAQVLLFAKCVAR